MSGKPAGAGAAETAAHQPTTPDAIRNVVLVGPAGSGKTTLVESLLHATGAINRLGRVEDGTSTSDYDEAEIRQQRSIGLSLIPLVAGGGDTTVKINLLDTPGYADFVGDLRAGLRAADCALFVVSASEGVDGATKALWQECEAVGMPRCVVISKLNHQRADYAAVLKAAQDAFGDKVVPLYVPVAHPGSEIDDLVALLSQTVSDYSEFSTKGRVVRQPGEDEQLLIEEHRGTLIEGVIEESEDESLMDRYMGGEDIDVDLLVDDLETAVARGSFFPVVPVCALSGLGLDELLEIITSAFPLALRARLPRGLHDRGQDRRPACRATRRARSSPRSSRRRPILMSAGSASRGSSPAPSVPTRPCTSPGTSASSTAPSAATRTTTRTSASVRCRLRWARPSGSSTPASPGTSARSRSCRAPRPETR